MDKSKLEMINIKRFNNLILIFILSLIICGCTPPSFNDCLSHVDDDFNGFCDKCLEEIENETETEVPFEFDMETYLTDLSERKAYIQEYLWNKYKFFYSAKFGFSISAAFIDMYNETGNQEYFDQAMVIAKKCYENVEKAADCFNICYAAYHYGLFSDLYTDELKAYAKQVFTTSQVYDDRPSTTNHALMFAVGTYLANQYFPGEIPVEYYGYDAVQTDDPTAEKTLYEIVELYPITGVYESNSTTYFPSHYFPLMAIADCSNDEVLANKCRIVIENSLFTLAPIWLNGHIAVANERNYQPFTAENEGGATNTLLWYYFGGRSEFPSYDQLDEAESMFVGFALYSDFLPNWISVAMSSDREEVYNHYETHLYTKDRWFNTYTFFINSYMHQDYSVYSSRDTVSKVNNGTGNFEYVACLRGFDRDIWGVDWITDNPNEKSNFSICNWDAEVTDNHTKIGNTVYSEVLQNNGTVIGVFDIPAEYDSRYPDYTYPRYLTINMPTNYKAIINESYKGEMYVHYGNLLIGFKLSLPFIYSGDIHTYTSDVTKAWFVCEVMDVDDVEGDTLEDQLYYFQSLCQSGFRSVEPDLTGRTKVSYTAIDGTTMSLQYGGDLAPTNGIINGVNQIYTIDSWPSQSNPWVKALYGDKEVTYTYKGHSITFDFKNWTVTEED